MDKQKRINEIYPESGHGLEKVSYWIWIGDIYQVNFIADSSSASNKSLSNLWVIVVIQIDSD